MKRLATFLFVLFGLLNAVQAEGVGPRASGGSGGITIGQAVTGGTPSTLLYNDAAGLIANSASIPFQVTDVGLTTTQPGWLVKITGDANPRAVLQLTAGDVPRLAFGGGTGGLDLFLTRRSAATFLIGGGDGASPIAQTLTVQNVSAGTTDTAGVDFTIAGSRSTGIGVAGNIVFQTAGSAAATGSTQNALATVLTVGPSTLRVGQTTPALAITPTWNAGTSTPTGLLLNVTDTASGAASLLLDLQVGGASKWNIIKNGNWGFAPASGSDRQFGNNGGSGTYSLVLQGSAFKFVELLDSGVRVAANRSIGFSSTSNDATAAFDTIIARDAANTLALRNGATAQTLRLYNTFTDVSNGEWLTIDWVTSANQVSILTTKNGTGTERILNLGGGLAGGQISLDNSGPITFNKRGTATRWQIDTNGHFIAGTDNAYDIGASGATRPRDEYLAGHLLIGGTTLTLTAGALGLAKITASGSAPGAGGAKLELVCGTNAGTAKLIIAAGTSGTAVTVTDNIGTGVTGC